MIQRTYASEAQRMQHYLELLAGKGRRTQYYLNQLAGLWSKPDTLYTCLGGRTHYRIPPDQAAVELVAGFTTPAQPLAIRCAALSALKHAHEFPELISVLTQACQQDENSLIRWLAAQASQNEKDP